MDLLVPRFGQVPAPDAGRTQDEKDSLAEFSQRFIELQWIDGELRNVAVQNTTIKAYALAFGPAANAFGAEVGGLSASPR